MKYTMIYKCDDEIKVKTVDADDLTHKIKLLETLADEGFALVSIIPAKTMTKEEVIKQLENLKKENEEFIDERYINESRPFMLNVEALEYAIEIIKQKG